MKIIVDTENNLCIIGGNQGHYGTRRKQMFNMTFEQSLALVCITLSVVGLAYMLLVQKETRIV